MLEPRRDLGRQAFIVDSVCSKGDRRIYRPGLVDLSVLAIDPHLHRTLGRGKERSRMKIGPQASRQGVSLRAKTVPGGETRIVSEPPEHGLGYIIGHRCHATCFDFDVRNLIGRKILEQRFHCCALFVFAVLGGNARQCLSQKDRE